MRINRRSARSWLTFTLFAIPLGVGGVIEAAQYEVQTITGFVGVRVYTAKKTSPGQFVFEYLSNFPQQMNMRVVFLNRDWRTHGCPSGQVVFTRNGQTQPGRVIVGTPEHVTYEFPNVPRTTQQAFRATCEMKSGTLTLYVVSGGATLRFQENPALEWDPGLPGHGSAKYEIEAPAEGQSFLLTEPVRARLRRATSSHLPGKVHVALERAVSSQTGFVGDIALPQNKVYIQWKPLTSAWVDTHWTRQAETVTCVVQLPGYLGEARTPEHEAGLYRLRVVGSSLTDPRSPWRSFHVRGKLMMQKVK